MQRPVANQSFSTAKLLAAEAADFTEKEAARRRRAECLFARQEHFESDGEGDGVMMATSMP